AISEVGDVRVEPFEPKSVAAEFDRGRATFEVSGIAVRVRGKRADLVRELLDIAVLEAPDNALEAARRTWLRRRSKETPARAATLLREAERGGSTSAAFARSLVDFEGDPRSLPGAELSAALERAHGSKLPDRALAELWTRWEFSASAGRALVEALRAIGKD